VLSFADGYAGLGLFLVALSVFHMWEYFFNVLYQPEDLSSDSFVVNHSPQYQFALAFGLAEYFVEKWFLFDYKDNFISLYIGLPLVLFGQFCRTLAMITGGSSFRHLVQDTKRADHKLVTHGIYQYLRHPAYFGFFWWSIGTQILLFNPLGVVLYSMASFSFMKDRIQHEEDTLIEQYGQDYVNYRKRTPVGIPRIP